MDHALIAALAYGSITTVGGLILAAKLATTRQELEDAQDNLAERDVDLALTREMNGSLLAEVTELRAERARRMAPLIAANAKRKADAAKAH
jgi:hypothetical protein